VRFSLRELMLLAASWATCWHACVQADDSSATPTVARIASYGKTPARPMRGSVISAVDTHYKTDRQKIIGKTIFEAVRKGAVGPTVGYLFGAKAGRVAGGGPVGLFLGIVFGSSDIAPEEIPGSPFSDYLKSQGRLQFSPPAPARSDTPSADRDHPGIEHGFLDRGDSGGAGGGASAGSPSGNEGFGSVGLIDRSGNRTDVGSFEGKPDTIGPGDSAKSGSEEGDTDKD
jgi:hypothetical protein